LSILQTENAACDLSDTGTGKTFVAVAVSTLLQLPTLVIVPKIGITAWHRTAEIFGEQLSVINYEKLRTGNTDFGAWQNQDRIIAGGADYFVCQCCQQRVDPGNPGRCYTNAAGIHCIEFKKSPLRRGRFSFHQAVKFIIFDEGHRCGGLDSLNAELMIAARRQQIKTLVLTATAGCSPLQFRALGYLLGLHNDKHARFEHGAWTTSFVRWAGRFGVRYDIAFHGLKWFASAAQQRDSMLKIRDSIIPRRGVRVTTGSISGFPEREITAELYDLNEGGKIDELYAEMKNALAELDRRKWSDIDPDNPLTIVLRAMQKIELLKVPIAVELANDYIAKGFSVGIFVNYRQTLVELSQRLNCNDIIDGTITRNQRQQVIDKFQANNARLILVNSIAGGITLSLHDLSGDYPRGGLVMPNFSATILRQLFGRFHREGGKTKCFYRVLFAAGTVEAQIHRTVAPKLNNLDSLNDADLMPENLQLTKTSFLNTIK